MAMNQGAGSGGGGFLQVLGIIYLVKTIRKRREQRRQREAAGEES